MLIGAADGIRAAHGAAWHPRRRHVRDRLLEQGRRVLGEVRVLSAFSAGRNLSVPEVIRSALASSAPGAYAQTADALPHGTAEQLTRREREVVALLSRGLTTNRQIAQALAITEGTASRHVENILGKLELHARAQVASLASRDLIR